MNPPAPSGDERTILPGAAPAEARTPGGNLLPTGTRLGEFEITDLIGEGGFGIVYVAWDHSLHRRVAIKEYMPAALAARSQGITVSVRSERHRETFQAALRSFINEARLLAQFDHPSLVKVYRFWEANGTAYMVMPRYEGATLKEVLKRLGGAPDEGWLRDLLRPLTAALALIHASQCFHRDIAPDNIIILGDGRPVLLDFGAARRVIGDMTHALTVILKPGYAPVEQYAESSASKQGAWTDIYALAAVVYFCITGKPPVPSVARLMSDQLEPLSRLAALRYSEGFLAAMDRALSVRPEDRPQSMEEFRDLLGIGDRRNRTRAAAPTVVGDFAPVTPTRSGPETRAAPTVPPPSPPLQAPAAVPARPPEAVRVAAPAQPATREPAVTPPPAAPEAAPAEGRTAAPVADLRPKAEFPAAPARRTALLAVGIVALFVLVAGAVGYLALQWGARPQSAAGATAPGPATTEAEERAAAPAAGPSPLPASAPPADGSPAAPDGEPVVPPFASPPPGTAEPASEPAPAKPVASEPTGAAPASSAPWPARTQAARPAAVADAPRLAKPAPSATTQSKSPRCSDLLLRASLGEQLTPEQEAFVRTQC